MSTEDGALPACFDNTADTTTYYNNIVLSLYEVGSSAIGGEAPADYTKYATVYKNDEHYMETTENNAPAITGTNIALANVDETTDAENAADITKLVHNKKMDLSARLTIDAQTVKYYVLKVEYVDRSMNQNAENLAGTDIIVSIRA